MRENKKAHWEKVYQTKSPDQLSWTQSIPQTSLDFIHGFNLSKTSKIIDVGGGDSYLADFLLHEGFRDITVLDISEAALDRAKARLGQQGKMVKWVVSDVTKFNTDEHYDLWHDRATFHFLTSKSQIAAYLDTAGRSVCKYMVIGTFSEKGPELCSGLSVKQYSEDQLQSQLSKDFTKIKCISEDHITPFQTKQNFLFCSFEARNIKLQQFDE